MVCTWESCEEVPKIKGMCKRHYDTSWRYANVERVRERAKRSYRRNLEKRKLQYKAYRERNLDKVKKKNDAWRKANPNYNTEHYQKFPEKNNEREARRRARKSNNGVFKIMPYELKKLYASPCFYCGSTEKITADHIVPISRGGRHSIGNLLPACFKCNVLKSNMFIMEWKMKLRKRGSQIA